MIKQLRAVIFENGTPKASDYANELFDSLGIEASVVNVYDKRPATQVLPVRAIPNVAVLLFADTLEEGQEIVDVVRQLEYIEHQEDIEAVGEILTDEQAVENPLLYDSWAAGRTYAADARVRSADKLWKCLQAHTSQEGWEPENTAALWVEIAAPGEYREIKADMLSTEAFALGEIGWWQTEDNLYKSLIDNNVYTPESYAAGWEKVEG